MHGSASKRHTRRRLDTRGSPSLLEREPALINLPIPLPSIPLLNPLITPLIAGPAKPTHTTPAAAPPPPASTPASSGGNSGGSAGGDSNSGGNNSGGGGSSGGSSSSSSGGGGGSSGDTSSGSSSGGDTSSGNASSGGGSSGGGSSSGNGSSGASSSGGGSPQSGSSGGSDAGSDSVPPSSGGGGSDAGTGGSASSSGLPGASQPSGVSSIIPGTGLTNGTTSSTSSDPSGNGATTSSGLVLSGSSGSSGSSDSGGAQNAGSDPNSTSGGSGKAGGASSSSGGSSGSTSSHSGKSGSGPSSASGGSSSDPSDPQSSMTGSDASASHGMSGAAIGGIVAAVLILSVFAVFFVLRRRSRRHRSERRVRWFATGEDADAEVVEGTRGLSARARQSARSSFGNPFDESMFTDDPMPASPTAFTAPPPMAQLHSPRSPVSAGAADTARYSVASSRSSGSHEGQVLTMPDPVLDRGNLLNFDIPIASPMSVRPFSPSESFAFPKPPGQQTPTKSADPFADEHSTHSTHSQPVHWPMYTPPAPEVQNPFADEASIASATTHASDVVPGAVEMVCRPFAPAREDELGVEEGELITVMEAFDDGWAQVKKKVNGATGLIPIDCFRQTGDDLPAFLASKRVSSYVEGGAYAA